MKKKQNDMVHIDMEERKLKRFEWFKDQREMKRNTTITMKTKKK